VELLTGEPLALDLVNTRARTPSGAEYDVLATPGTFQPWLVKQAGRLAAPGRPLTARDLAVLRELRGHVETALDAVRQAVPAPPEALTALNEALRVAPPYAYLEARGAVLVGGTRRDGSDLERLLTQLAEAALALLTDPGVGKVRQCEAPQCRMLFLPAHPRRRWCSPELCGNRIRVARYYQRHKPTA
jgi:predicted RNA-binding Zn ribbon-like protein